MQALRVAINAQIQQHSGAGGVESVLLGLLSALGKLDGPEEYIVIGPQQDSHWLQPYLGPNQHVVTLPESANPKPGAPGPLEPLKKLLGPLRPKLRAIWRELFPLPADRPVFLWPEVPVSDGFYEGLGCEVIHFPYQSFILCAIPTVYNPHDLQHRHYPAYFTPAQLAWRETIYPAGCKLAQKVAVASQWVKQDLVAQYGISEAKIQVIPWAPPTQVQDPPTEELLNEVLFSYQLRQPYAYYPAMTWEHKNHLRLLQAIAYLRDQHNIRVNLVCSGARSSKFWPKIEACLQELALADQVQFLGLIPHQHLRAVYRLSQFVIVPTLFEAASAPVFEAWQEGVPVACSNVTSLPEQVADAALLFNPFSIEEIAQVLLRMFTEASLRCDLVQRGRQRLGIFSWERTAKAYRAVYRHLAHRQLSEEDQFLLNWDWMRDSKNLMPV